MKMLFLGTGAADWSPDRDIAGQEYRGNCSALVDGSILIDPGPTVPRALEKFDIAPRDIRYVINTHTHRDHFNADTLAFLQSYGAEHVRLTDGDSLYLGDVKVSAVRGNHRSDTYTLHYMFESDGHRIFYALDGAWLMYDEVELIKQAPVDICVLDGTVGFGQGDYRVFEHNNMAMVIQMKDTLTMYARDFYISHMSCGLHTDHDTLARAMAEHGINVAYDGLEIVL